MATIERLRAHAKRMRHAPTEAEHVIWTSLRAGRLAGLKFKRQQPIGRYIVDFVCFERRIVIEIDGSQHLEAASQDYARTAWLQEQGFRVVRFWNDEVLRDTERVLEEIMRVLGTS